MDLLQLEEVPFYPWVQLAFTEFLQRKSNMNHCASVEKQSIFVTAGRGTFLYLSSISFYQISPAKIEYEPLCIGEKAEYFSIAPAVVVV